MAAAAVTTLVRTLWGLAFPVAMDETGEGRRGRYSSTAALRGGRPWSRLNRRRWKFFFTSSDWNPQQRFRESECLVFGLPLFAIGEPQKANVEASSL